MNLLIFHLFFSRVVTSYIGFNILNLVNIFIIPIIYLFFYFYRQKHSRIQMVALVLICIISTYYNQISITNTLIFLTIVLYPYFIFQILDQINFTKLIKQNFEKKIFFCFLINAVFSYVQFLNHGIGDEIKGLFIGMGAGHHINGALTLFYSLYIFLNNMKKYKFFLIANSLIVIISDSKQVVLAIMIGLFLYFIFSLLKTIFLRDKKNFIRHFFFNTLYMFIILILFTLFFNFDLFYFNTELLNPRYLLLGLEKKFAVFNYFNNNDILLLLIGNGPGMTVSKLSYMANYENTYVEILNILNYTFSDLAKLIKEVQLSDWQTDFRSTGSSLFQLTFSIAGFTGDMGILGLFFYLLIIKKIILLNQDSYINQIVFFIVLSLGMIFSWLEEPSFMFMIVFTSYIQFNLKKTN